VSSVVTALAVGTVAMASASTSPSTASTTITGCVAHDGTLRILNQEHQHCQRNETLITWNQTGPAGPPGPAGAGGP
jgi:hypothetical protein